jgi:hypothetical protein
VDETSQGLEESQEAAHPKVVSFVRVKFFQEIVLTGGDLLAKVIFSGLLMHVALLMILNLEFE